MSEYDRARRALEGAGYRDVLIEPTDRFERVFHLTATLGHGMHEGYHERGERLVAVSVGRDDGHSHGTLLRDSYARSPHYLLRFWRRYFSDRDRYERTKAVRLFRSSP